MESLKLFNQTYLNISLKKDYLKLGVLGFDFSILHNAHTWIKAS